MHSSPFQNQRMITYYLKLFQNLKAFSITLLQTFLRLNTMMKSLATKVISLSIVRKKKSPINKIKSKTKIVALFVSNHFQIQTMWRNTLNTSMKKLNVFIVICAVVLFIMIIIWEGISRESMRQKWALICQNTKRVRHSAQM